MVRPRTQYPVTLRDDRFNPERAVPAAATYLARLPTKFGGRDWAVIAYHCGEGCVAELLPLAQASVGSKQPSVAAPFFCRQSSTPSRVVRRHPTAHAP